MMARDADREGWGHVCMYVCMCIYGLLVKGDSNIILV